MGDNRQAWEDQVETEVTEWPDDTPVGEPLLEEDQDLRGDPVA